LCVCLRVCVRVVAVHKHPRSEELKSNQPGF
jgi:hypothetical protein